MKLKLAMTRDTRYLLKKFWQSQVVSQDTLNRFGLTRDERYVIK